MRRRSGRLQLIVAMVLLAGGLALAVPPSQRWAARERFQQQEQPDARPLRLVIPGVGLRQALLQGGTPENLDLAPTVLDPVSAEEQGTVIIAHRDTHFNGLKHLRTGMLVALERDGSIRYFTVKDIEVHSPAVMEERVRGLRGGDRLLLVTCHPFRYFGSAPNRFVAICEPAGNCK
jgi:sortase A